jgi:SAM-dependent methyltransferase
VTAEAAFPDAGPSDAEFSGAAYAACTAHHRAHDTDVLSPVAWRAGMRVLDLGCGVGDLTARVADLVAPGEVLGVDASASQVEHALAGAGADPGRPGLRFEVARAQELDRVVPPAWADVVLSVATLHWVPEADQPVVLRQVARALVAGGTFRADLGGHGQIADTRDVLDEVAAAHGVAASSWFFPDEDTAAGLLVDAGLDVTWARLVRQRRPLADADALEGWLRSQVLPGYGRSGPAGPGSDAYEAFADEAVRRCVRELRREDGGFAQHYVRMDVLATRP